MTKQPVRPDVVEDLVRRFAGDPHDQGAIAEHLAARIRDEFGAEVSDGPTEEEYRWALQRVRGMTPEELAEAARQPGGRHLRLVDEEGRRDDR
jgi:hypothetical protein